MNIKKIHSDRVGHFVLEFDKENSLSLLFCNGSHTDHYSELDISETHINGFSSIEEWMKAPAHSTTLEIMPFGDKIIKICSEYKEYWSEPLLDYFPVEKLMELLNKIEEK